MATNYFIYDSDSDISLDELNLPENTVVLVSNTPEAHDALIVIQQGYPERPFLASLENGSWVITYYKANTVDLSNNVIDLSNNTE